MIARMTWRKLAFVFVFGSIAACGGGNSTGGGDNTCDPGDPNSCGPGERCNADTNVCEPYAACDTNDPDSCPAGFVCRPSSEGPVCEPEGTAGRIPGCIDSDGLDVFAVEANRTLAVSWNVNGTVDHTGGFRVVYGTATETYDQQVELAVGVRELTLTDLTNDTTYYVAVRTLDSSDAVTFTSCEVNGTPHILAFQPEFVVAGADGDQSEPGVASDLEGEYVYLAWEDEGTIKLSISTDFGDNWTTPEAVSAGTGQSQVDLAVREAAFDESGTQTRPEVLLIAWHEGSKVLVARYLPGNDEFQAPAEVQSGGTYIAPGLAVADDVIHVAFAESTEGAIYHATSTDGGASFSPPTKISGSTVEAASPNVAASGLTGDVHVAWHARLGSGNTDIYSTSSFNNGATFGDVVRVDDDATGQNQKNVSVAIDERTQRLYATWEDRRGGSNVYFAWVDVESAPVAPDWGTNLHVSNAGLGGDQFKPKAVVDVARNVYVAFQDTSDGARVVFTRFNSDGGFDPALEPSAQAGQGGVVGDFPAVATDRFGAVYVAWQENRSGPDTDVVFARAE